MNNEVGALLIATRPGYKFGVNCEKSARPAHVQLRLKSNKLFSFLPLSSTVFKVHTHIYVYILLYMYTSVHTRTSKFTFNNPDCKLAHGYQHQFTVVYIELWLEP